MKYIRMKYPNDRKSNRICVECGRWISIPDQDILKFIDSEDVLYPLCEDCYNKPNIVY